MAETRIILCGCLGKMGQNVRNEVKKTAGFVITAGVDIAEAEDINGIKFIAKVIKNSDGNGLRAICDEIRGMESNVAAVLATVNGEKIVFTATCGKNVVARGIKAGDMVRETAKTAGGNGGGKPDFAMAGGNDVSKLDEALAAAKNFVFSKA